MATGKLLDKLLSNLNVHAEPFARCTISSGWRLGLPGPSGVMLHFVLEGRGMLRDAAGQRSELRPYFLVIVPPGTRHDLESPGNIEHEVRVEGPPPKGVWNPLLLAGSLDSETNLVVACGLVRVQFGDSLGLFDHMKEMMVVDLSDVPQVGTAFQDIFTEQSQPSPGSEAMTAALMSQCMVHLLRKLCEDDQCPLPWLAALENERLARAIDRILEQPGAHHTVESLAEVAAMSRSAFAENFAAAFSRPPMTLVHHVRMQRAAQLLRQANISVDEVADRVGFSSRSHFSRAFKKHTGLAPHAYSQGWEGGAIASA